MNIELSDLIVGQLKTIGTMAAAGLLVAAGWQGKNHLVYTLSARLKRKKAVLFIGESAFWIGGAVLIPEFLYYCTYGKVTFCSILGIITGVFLWKIFIKKVFK